MYNLKRITVIFKFIKASKLAVLHIIQMTNDSGLIIYLMHELLLIIFYLVFYIKYFCF
jgi:hypothetical protein